MTEIKIKRIYQKVDRDDGFRILVDRLWPRGIKKDEAKINLWLKDIAPSPDLRKWFNHDPEKWLDFCKKYHKQLESQQDHIQTILKALHNGSITLLYAAKDEHLNNAVSLKKYLEHYLAK